MTEKPRNDDVLGVDVQAAPPRRFFTPLSCCLGCVGLLVVLSIVVVVAVYWFFNNKFLADTPIAIDLPAVSDADVASAQEKHKAFTDGAANDVTFTQSELNALLQKVAAPAYAKAMNVDPAQCKALVELTGDNQIKLAVSALFRPGKYVNLEFLGSIAIENGKGTITNVKYTRLGNIGDIPSDYFTGHFDQMRRGQADEVFGKDHAELKTLKVENGQLHLVFEPAAPKGAEQPPEK